MPAHPFDLTGKVALVTGGNGGIGFAVARALANAGATIAIWGRREEANIAAAAKLRADGATVFSDAVDIGDEDAVNAALARLLGQVPQVDIFVANAGTYIRRATFLDIDAEARDEVFATNLQGSWITLQALVRHMADRGAQGRPGGSIIVTGSIAAFGGLRGGEHYGATKAALGVIVKGIAIEYGSLGIRANMICPGFIERDGIVGRYTDQVAERNPIPRYGRPDEIGGMAVYLASDAASYHTGDIVTIDGGWMATSAGPLAVVPN